jgi:UDP-glucose 4-epimerase/UDP-arabinose 4-epimerase
MNIPRANILVIGGAGYIGSHCAKALSAAGFVPVVYDNLSTGHREFVKWGPLVEGDILDTAHLEATLDKFKPVAVMHFAGGYPIPQVKRERRPRFGAQAMQAS